MSGMNEETNTQKKPRGKDGRKRTQAVIVGEVLKDVDQAHEQRVEEQQLPSRGKLWLPAPPRHNPVDSVDTQNHDAGDNRRAQESVRESAMLRKARYRSAKEGEDVCVWRLGSEDQG